MEISSLKQKTVWLSKRTKSENKRRAGNANLFYPKHNRFAELIGATEGLKFELKAFYTLSTKTKKTLHYISMNNGIQLWKKKLAKKKPSM